MFLSAHQGYIHLIENTVYEILIVLNIKNAIYSSDAKLNFQHHYSGLQRHMIFQKSF